MARPASYVAAVTAVLLLIAPRARSQAFNGYTLFGPNNGRNTYLVNMSNTVVHSWSHTRSGGYSVYLLDDGSIVRCAMATNPQLNGGGAEGVVQRVAWNGTMLWEYTYSNASHLSHHDVEPMPNGNVLLIAWEVKTAAQAVAAGLNRSQVIWPDHIVEVQPSGSSGGNIVWEWHAWDHLVQQYDASKANYGVVANHPELLNINMGAGGVGPGGGDWMHINGISYNPDLDQIVISSHTLNEIYVIDHSTTTAQAATHSGGRSGKGGDILYRWGMPSNYGAPGGQYFAVVHCSWWIPKGLPGEGHILAYNNREGQSTSIVVELTPPSDVAGNYSWIPGTAFAPAAPAWSYTAAGFFSNHLGGNQRLPNGNTLIVESTSGYLFEVTPEGVVVWSYARGGEIPRALRYPPDHPFLKTLEVEGTATVLPGRTELMPNYPNPFNPRTEIGFRIAEYGFVKLGVYDLLGREIATLVNESKAPGEYTVPFDAAGLPSGVYIYRLTTGATADARRMVLTR
jgi:hypothetical protein